MTFSGASVGGCERGGELISHLQSYLSIKLLGKEMRRFTQANFVK